MSSEMTKGLSVGSEVIARQDFQTTTTEQLPFYKGDILTIIGTTDKIPTSTSNCIPQVASATASLNTKGDEFDWYLAQRCSDGKKGLVPSSHLQKRSEVKLNSTPWFHGKITRDEAEKLLQPPKVSIHRLILHNIS